MPWKEIIDTIDDETMVGRLQVKARELHERRMMDGYGGHVPPQSQSGGHGGHVSPTLELEAEAEAGAEDIELAHRGSGSGDNNTNSGSGRISKEKTKLEDIDETKAAAGSDKTAPTTIGARTGEVVDDEAQAASDRTTVERDERENTATRSMTSIEKRLDGLEAQMR